MWQVMQYGIQSEPCCRVAEHRLSVVTETVHLHCTILATVWEMPTAARETVSPWLPGTKRGCCKPQATPSYQNAAQAGWRMMLLLFTTNLMYDSSMPGPEIRLIKWMDKYTPCTLGQGFSLSISLAPLRPLNEHICTIASQLLVNEGRCALWKHDGDRKADLLACIRNSKPSIATRRGNQLCCAILSGTLACITYATEFERPRWLKSIHLYPHWFLKSLAERDGLEKWSHLVQLVRESRRSRRLHIL
mmetsp:Transcript_33352/g.94482  ORF Transcript_33352/g.94482 Transcript_33352/m.94482 type:complete len:247 (-) Transcript_33352:294-1034(-)